MYSQRYAQLVDHKLNNKQIQITNKYKLQKP